MGRQGAVFDAQAELRVVREEEKDVQGTEVGEASSASKGVYGEGCRRIGQAKGEYALGASFFFATLFDHMSALLTNLNPFWPTLGTCPEEQEAKEQVPYLICTILLYISLSYPFSGAPPADLEASFTVD